MRIHSLIAGSAVLAALAFATSVATTASDLDGILVPCGENRMCPWVKTKAEAPKGWVEDKEWTERYQSVFFFEGGDQGKDKPVIYVRTHLANASIELGPYIADAQKQWRGSHKQTKIEPQADITRAGKPAFKVFLYKNPTVKDQAFELTAFTKDTDPSHGNATYFQQAVLIAPTQAVLDAARPAFEELLGRL